MQVTPCTTSCQGLKLSRVLKTTKRTEPNCERYSSSLADRKRQLNRQATGARRLQNTRAATSSEEPLEVPPDIPSLGKVDYVLILNHVLKMTATKHKSRYRAIMDSALGSNLKETLIANLSAAVINAFEEEIHGSEDLQNFGEKPRRSMRRAYTYISCGRAHGSFGYTLVNQ